MTTATNNDPFASFAPAAGGAPIADLGALNGLDLSGLEVVEDNNFRAPQPGVHNAVVSKLECTTSKNSGAPQIVVTYEIDDVNDPDHGLPVRSWVVFSVEREMRGAKKKVLNPGFKRLLADMGLWTDDPGKRTAMLSGAGLPLTVDKLFKAMMGRRCVIETSLDAPRQRKDRVTQQPLFNADGTPLMGDPWGRVDRVDFEAPENATVQF